MIGVETLSRGLDIFEESLADTLKEGEFTGMTALQISVGIVSGGRHARQQLSVHWIDGLTLIGCLREAEP